MQNKQQILGLSIGTKVDIFLVSDGEDICVDKDLTVIRNNDENISFGVGKSKLHTEINEEGFWERNSDQMDGTTYKYYIKVVG